MQRDAIYLRALLRGAANLFLWLPSFLPLCAQTPPLIFEEEYLLKSVWQEYLPDAYALDDGTILLAGLSTNMRDLTVNIFLRNMHPDGEVIYETEILCFDNPEGHSYLHSTYYCGSAVDDTSIYVLTNTPLEICDPLTETVRAYRMVKARLTDGMAEKDTILCYDDIRVFGALHTSALDDSLYLYGSLGYLNLNPDIILTAMTKDLGTAVHHTLRTTDTHLLPLGIPGHSRAVAGSHYRHAVDNRPYLQDIWLGRIAGDTILEALRMEYFASHVTDKVLLLNTDEIGIIGNSNGAAYNESSAYLIRGDTLVWNFYDVFFQEFNDMIKVGDQYCVVQSSYEEQDDRLDKVILHYLDSDGFAFARETFITPWIQFALGGLKLADQYLVFVYIRDWDVVTAVADGEIPLTEAQFEYTHVLRFRIHE